MLKQVVFIGNRVNVFKELVQIDNFILKQIFVLKDSFLHKYLLNESGKYSFRIFEENKHCKNEILFFLQNEDYDILVSNGCPFILPVSKLKQFKPNSLFINTHPTYLPHLKGKTPLNGVFYLGYDFIGATTHFMDDGIDTGEIINQEKVTLTSDIDQGLVYFISFHLEGKVFKNAMQQLISCDFVFEAIKQTEEGSYFNRESVSFAIDFSFDKMEDIVRKVKSVGIIQQGICCTLSNKKFHFINAESIINEYLLSIFNTSSVGEIVLQYSNKVLVKCQDGVVAFTKGLHYD